MSPHEGHLLSAGDRKRVRCQHSACESPAHWCEYSRFATGLAAYGKGIAFYYSCRAHSPPRLFRLTLGKRTGTFAAPTPGDARDAALRAWFGPGVYWDSHEVDGPRVGRVVQQKIRKSHGKDRFVDEPLTKWVKLTIREVRS